MTTQPPEPREVLRQPLETTRSKNEHPWIEASSGNAAAHISNSTATDSRVHLSHVVSRHLRRRSPIHLARRSNRPGVEEQTAWFYQYREPAAMHNRTAAASLP